MPGTVTLFSLGGTIASTNQERSGIGVKPNLSAEDLVVAVPQLRDFQISASTFRQVPSADLTVRDLIELAEAIRRAVAKGTSGVVVTQGTDTIEETAFALDCMLQVDVPVVVTGAMRNPDLPGADGPANLLAAVQTAASTVARGLGTVVVFNDEIHAAQFVKKTHTASTATFQSSLAGPIGWIAEGIPRVVLQPQRHWHVDVANTDRDSFVALIKLGLGENGALLQALESLDYAGLVVEGYGGGHVPSRLVESLERFAKRMPVVFTSRTGTGEILSHTYSFPGSERDLLERGLISAGILDGPKARLLLTLLLMSGQTHDEIKAAFSVDSPAVDS